MNEEIKLPPLPAPDGRPRGHEAWFLGDTVQDYARAAILADRAARPVADAGEADITVPRITLQNWYEQWQSTDAACTNEYGYLGETGDPGLAELEKILTTPSTRAPAEAPSDAWNGSVQQVICDLPLPQGSEKERQRLVDAKALILDSIRALQGKPEAGGPRFTSERPDILHAIYKGFQRGDSVERVHFDVCALIKAGAK